MPWKVETEPDNADACKWKMPSDHQKASAAPEDIRLPPEEMTLTPEEMQADEEQWTIEQEPLEGS